MKPYVVKPIRICLIIYFIILAAFLCYIFFRTDLQDFYRAYDDGLEYDYTADWVLDTGETVDIDDVSAPGFRNGLTISKKLPEVMAETDAICFSSNNLVFKVFVNDDLIYAYDTEKNLTGTGDGVSFHIIGLGTKDEGDTIRIEGHTAFASGSGGRISGMLYCAPEQYRYYLIRHNIFGIALSFLMIVFGACIIIFFFGMSYKNPIVQPLWALGLSAIIFGLWSLSDTGMPQFLTGSTYAARDTVYLILHLAGFPMVYFINSVTKLKRRTYLYIAFLLSVLSFCLLLFTSLILGRDLHTMVELLYFSYASQLALYMIILIDNEIYCRRKKVSSNLSYFYIGAGIFVAASFIDMIRYLAKYRRTSTMHGSWFRIGLAIFFVFMSFQIFDWWLREKTSLERDRFINRLLQYIMDSMDPDEKINRVLEYLCEELHADRAYIFEDMKDGTFDNTYEYCAANVTPEIDNLKGLPYDGTIDVWYDEYKKGGHILIYDLEKYKDVSENMYNVLKPQGINTLVTGPLILDGEYIGFFGVDNPPPEMMTEVSEIIRLLMFFLSELLSQRDNHKRLIEYSYQDALTGVGNRRAIKEFELEELDTSRPYGFVMCDINGLKAINDNQGHEAGDALIKDVAACLSSVFGRHNVYRMGGDEFAVYVCDTGREEFEELVKKVRVMVTGKGHHVAIGVSYAENGDPDYNSRKIEADNRMYDEKREFYRGRNDRRSGG